MGNTVETLPTQPDIEMTTVCCTYCSSPEPAIRTCLQCKTSFCGKHLHGHSKSSEHILLDPTANLEDKKCSTHKEALKYYCPMDATFICVYCWVTGDHKGHHVHLLDEAFAKKKDMVRSAVEKMNTDKMEAERKIQDLTDHGIEEENKSSILAEKVTNLFADIRKKLDDLERKVQGEISRQKDQVSLSVSDMIGQMELHKDELTKKIHHLEVLCDMTDPFDFLCDDLNKDDISDKSCDVIADTRKAQCVDEIIVSQMLHRGLVHFVDLLNNMRRKGQIPVMKKSQVLLDINSAHDNITISRKLRSATYTATSQNRPDGPKRFMYPQVLSSRRFSSGKHYWEVDVSQAEVWAIGVVEESLERKVEGLESYIGYNEKSWGVMLLSNLYVSHNNIHKQLSLESPVKFVGIYLDYEAGRLSFYQLNDPIRHLHTFTADFAEPLYPAFFVLGESIIRIIK